MQQTMTGYRCSQDTKHIQVVDDWIEVGLAPAITKYKNMVCKSCKEDGECPADCSGPKKVSIIVRDHGV